MIQDVDLGIKFIHYPQDADEYNFPEDYLLD